MTSAGQVRHGFPAWKIYCFGVDVTEDATSVTLNWNDARTPNISQFTLSSELNRYVITAEDIHALYDDLTTDDVDADAFAAFTHGLQATDDTSHPEGQLAFRNDIDRAIRKRLRKTIKDPLKAAVLLSKFNERVKGQSQPAVSEILTIPLDSLTDQARDEALQSRTSLHKFNALSGDYLRFPFQEGVCIFHTGDPITIFIRDPFSPTEWFFGGRGFLSDWNDREDENGEKTVSMWVEDPLRMYRLARFSTNWSIFDVNAISNPKYDSLFRTWKLDNFSDLSLQEILFLITFGAGAAGKEVQEKIRGDKTALAFPPIEQYRYGINGRTANEPRTEGAGHFDFDGSKIFVFGAPSEISNTTQGTVGGKVFEEISSLGDWQSSIDHKVSPLVDDVVAMCLPEFRTQKRAELNSVSATEGVLDIEFVMKEIGENPHLYPVDFGRLMLLLPASLGPGTDRSVFLKDLVQGIATTTQFSNRLAIIYNVCERLDFSFYATPKGDVVCEMPLYSFTPNDFGTFSNRYLFPKEDIITGGSQFSDERVKTQFVMSWQPIENIVGTGNALSIGFKPSTVDLKALIPQFGIRSETADVPGFIASPKAAAYYALVKLTQMNADAWTNDMSTVMHLGIGPNRPLWFEWRNFIATCRGVTSNIKWGASGSVSQTVNLNYRRGWSGQMTQDGQQLYESYGGIASQPLNYAMMFRDKKLSGPDVENTKSIEPVASNTRPIQTLTNQEQQRRLAIKQRFVPDSPEARELFAKAIAAHNTNASQTEQISMSFAVDPALHALLAKESQGYVGRPNFQYGSRATDPSEWHEVQAEVRSGQLRGQDFIPPKKRSSAIGLGQLTRENAKKYYPSGLQGVGNADEEALGMIRYVKTTYGTPTAALEFHKKHGYY